MSDMKVQVFSILLAGGTGTRLWPVSRELYPKQLVKFIGKDSLIQSTIKRLAPALGMESVRIVCGEEHFHEIARHMEEIGVKAEGKIICEPCGRNTAPAILLAMLDTLKKEKDAVLCVFPADHVIRNIGIFHERLEVAIRLADLGYIVTFGIKPHCPETGYGYIEGAGEVLADALSIKRFVEKPDTDTARRYVEDGNFFWNSGMFAFKASVMMEEFRIHQPELLTKIKALILNEDPITRKGYEQLPNISIDYAIMEKTDKGVVLPSDFGWSDIGTWKSLYDFLPKDGNNNVIEGDVITKDTENCFIMGYERLIATNHLNNMVVVETPDSVFVSDMDHSRDAKFFVSLLKEKGRKEHHWHMTRYHPWGSFTLLEQEKDLGVARLMVLPGSELTDTLDISTAKHVLVVNGQAKIQVGTQFRLLEKGESAVLSGTDAVKIENSGPDPLYLIQVEMRLNA